MTTHESPAATSPEHGSRTRVSFYNFDDHDIELQEKYEQESRQEVETLLHSRRLWRERAKRIRTPVRHQVLQLRSVHLLQPTYHGKNGVRHDPREMQTLRALEEQVRADEVSKLSEDLSVSLQPLTVTRGPLEHALLRLHTTTPATPYLYSRATTSKGYERGYSEQERTGTSMTGYSVLSEPYEPLYMLPPERAILHTNPRRHKSFCNNWKSLPQPHDGFHFQKGVHQTDMFTRKELAEKQEINGPIQMQLYSSHKADLLRPLLGRGTLSRQTSNQKRINSIKSFVRVKPVRIQSREAAVVGQQVPHRQRLLYRYENELHSNSGYTITRPNTPADNDIKLC